AEPLAVKFPATVRTDPWEQLERLLPVGLLKLSLSTPCHRSLGGGGDSFSILLRELCARPGEYPNSWFDPACLLRVCTPSLDGHGALTSLISLERTNIFFIPPAVERRPLR